MIRRPLLALLLPLAACHSLATDGANRSEVPESTLSLVAEGSERACSAADVQDVIGRQLRPDGGGLSPAPPAAVLTAAQAALHYTLDEISLASTDRGVPSVTCDAQLTVSAPDEGVAAPAPVPIRFVVRPASAASATLDVAIQGSAPRAAARALFAQVVARIQARGGQQPPVTPGYDGPTVPGTTIPGMGGAGGGQPDITADNGDIPAPTPAPTPKPPPPSPPTGPTAGNAPSFDCSTVTSATLQAVCADPRLARLDRRLAELYRRRIADADPDERPDLVADERAWIAERQRCGDDPDCIEQSYRDRLGALSDVDR